MSKAPKYPVTRTSLPPFEEYCEAIRPLWESRWITNMGPLHEELADALADRFGCRVTLFANGHLAIEATLRALLGSGPGEIVTTPFTFVSTTHAIVRCGFTPVFCDVLPEDGTMDPALLESLITPRTVAILPVHVYGHPCDIDTIGDIARRHGLPVLYDAAHAFGVRYKGVPLVRAGDASVLSFHATKVFSTIEGGAVCYDAPLGIPAEAFASRLDDEKNFGIRDAETCVAAGGNAKLGEFSAAMGLCNLRHFEAERDDRLAASGRYDKLLLAGIGVLSRLRPREGTEPAGAYYPLLLPDRATRDRVYTALRADSIGARKYFFPLTSRTECYAACHFAGETPVGEDLASRVLCLPLYAGLTPSDTALIASAVLRAI